MKNTSVTGQKLVTGRNFHLCCQNSLLAYLDNVLNGFFNYFFFFFFFYKCLLSPDHRQRIGLGAISTALHMKYINILYSLKYLNVTSNFIKFNYVP